MTSRPPPADERRLDNPLDALLGYQLRRASAAFMTDLAHSLVELALTPTEASVLLLIECNPGATQSDIGRVLAIKRANMTPIAAMLTKRGLVDRTHSDGRSQGLRLSMAGSTTAQDVRCRIDVHEAEFLPNLPRDERTELISLLRQVWLR